MTRDALELNPFLYGPPLEPENCIRRDAERLLLLRLAASGQNARLSAPRRYGKTTLIEEVRAAAEDEGLNTVRVDLYGVASRAEVALRLERAYRALRGPMARAVNGVLRRTKVKVSGGAPGARIEAEPAAADENTDSVLLDLLDLPIAFYKRTSARTLVIYDEFQDVLEAGGGVDALIRSRIQHHGPAASYVFAGSHPGLMSELFGNKSRPLYGQARAVQLRPLPDLAVAEYIETRFAATGRTANRVLDDLVALARGHPLRAMHLAHHLWERTSHGEPADVEEWSGALSDTYDELQESYEWLWDSHAGDVDRAVVAAVAAGVRRLSTPETLHHYGLDASEAREGRDRLLASGDLQRVPGGEVELVDPLYAAWVAADRLPPEPSPRPDPSSRPLPVDDFPFGIPDAARAPLSSLTADVLTDWVDRAVRIVVGRPGSGRTFALRRMQLETANDDSVYASDLSVGGPRTADVLRITESTRPALAAETWQRVWRAAILRSVATQLAAAPRLTRHLDPGTLEALADFPVLYPAPRRPAATWSHLRAIIADHEDAGSLQTYLRHPDWLDLEELLADALRHAPPLYLFLDGLDEEYGYAPSAWLRCQEGLFLAIMELLRSAGLGSRLHVVAAIRDHVFFSVLAGEHATRWARNPYIRVLQWEQADALRLLEDAAKRLGEASLLRPELGPTIAGWLGVEAVADPDRGDPVPIAEYLLRHTRWLPRDVSLLGNLLAREVGKAKAAGATALAHATLTATVDDAARVFGSESLAACSNVLAAELQRTSAPASPGEDPPWASDWWRSLGSQLVALLRETRGQRLSAGGLARLRERAVEEFGGGDLPEILFREGVLGYADEGATNHTLRYGRSMASRWLPLDAAEYGFHPVVVSVIEGPTTDL